MRTRSICARRRTAPWHPGSRCKSSATTASYCQQVSRASLRCGDPSGCSVIWDPAANRTALDDAGWFRTGDVGILDDDGFLTITGRIKDVINRGGEKFSARDIEDLLASHPSVRQAAVVPGPDARFGEVPVAFVVLNGGWQSSVGELAAHLQTVGLARQKSPTAWYFVDALPMTPSGKVKKFELAATAAAAGGSP